LPDTGSLFWRRIQTMKFLDAAGQSCDMWRRVMLYLLLLSQTGNIGPNPNKWPRMPILVERKVARLPLNWATDAQLSGDFQTEALSMGSSCCITLKVP
jgi:hypothetical protein